MPARISWHTARLRTRTLSALLGCLAALAALAASASVSAGPAPRCDVGVRLRARNARSIAAEQASSSTIVGWGAGSAARSPAGAAGSAPRGGTSAGRSSAIARLAVSAWVDGGGETLARAGFAVSAAQGDIAYLDVSPDELDALAALPSVRAIEEARPLHTNLDRSGPAVAGPAARVMLGLDGQGVVLGVVDTGLDFRHADFRRADGSTRLLALLDVSHPPDARHPDLGSWPGAVWLPAEIQAQLDAEARGQAPAVVVSERDTDGHGTHVTGIAAGGGLATAHGLPAGRYVGVAPGAAIVAVKASRQGASFYEQDVLQGIRFVFDRATAAGLPAVVNLSIGGGGGAHDGTTNFERAISALVPSDARGRAIVVAAGNGGSRDHHAGAFTRGGLTTLAVPFPSSATLDQALSIDLWSDAAPAAISLVAPSGATYGPVLRGKAFQGSLHGPDGQVAIDDAPMGADAINHRFASGVLVAGERRSAMAPAGVPVAGGTWKLILDFGAPSSASAADAPIRWDAWLNGVAVTAAEPRFVDHLDEDDRADVPAFAERVIAVGSFVSRNSWLSVDTRTVTRDLVVGRASSFSGSGPASDGRFLPDLSAPGDFVLSALSSDAPPSSPVSVFYVAGDAAYLVGDDGLHGALRGTSQAAPHVAGAAALLYSIDPTMPLERLREILRASATVEVDAPGYSPRAGFGRLDVLAAARLALRLSTGVVDAQASSVGVNRDVAPPGGPPVLISVVPRDASGAPLGPGHVVVITSDAGVMQGPERDLGGGRYERTLLPHAVEGSIARLSVRVDGVALAASPRVWFSTERASAGGALPTRGCSIGNLGGNRGGNRSGNRSGDQGGGASLRIGLAALVVGTALRSRRRRRRASPDCQAA